MKFLPLPEVDDEAALKSVTGRNPLAQCPQISDDLETVLKSYASYLSARGNPHAPESPAPVELQGLLHGVLPRRYDDPSEHLAYIDEIRQQGSPHVCPMCGAPKPTTVDHIFPESVYEELAIFSRNLVPACWDCNHGHQNRFKGNAPNQRLLHPYFDGCLENRLVVAEIEPVEGSYRTPEIDLVPTLPEHDPLFETVEYHIEEVIKPAGAISSLNTHWLGLQRAVQPGLPHVYFQRLPIGPFSDAEFEEQVGVALSLADIEFHTPNNLKSMLYAGMRRNSDAMAFLAAAIRELRANPDHAEDV